MFLERDVIQNFEKGRLREAEDRFFQNISELEKTQSGVECLGWVLNRLGAVLLDGGKLRDAEKLAERSLAKFKTNHPPDDRIFLEPLQILAAVHLRRGEIALARGAVRKLQTLRTRWPAQEALIGTTRADLYQAEGRYAEAEQEYIAVLGISEKVDLNSRVSYETLNSLGLLYAQQMQFREAWNAFEKAKTILRMRPDFGDYDHMRLLNDIGLLQYRQRYYAQAVAYFRKAADLAEGLQPSNGAALKTVLLNYAIALHKAKRKPEAKAIESRAKAIHTEEENTSRHLIDATALR